MQLALLMIMLRLHSVLDRWRHVVPEYDMHNIPVIKEQDPSTAMIMWRERCGRLGKLAVGRV